MYNVFIFISFYMSGMLLVRILLKHWCCMHLLYQNYHTAEALPSAKWVKRASRGPNRAFGRFKPGIKKPAPLRRCRLCIVQFSAER
ncbi:hypothetical protein DXN05_13985 [Deminuibacter soli]|uniref:Uncharacterized protein n=1 Tax=Deminuibacter soli TaxID=2291815 RepID=A0A3E1NIR1_9BACT|nr:hypothetical protein DXN05_13985 [Deminuibacter soli]